MENETYYEKISKKMFKEFELMYNGTIKLLLKYFNMQKVDNIYQESREYYIKLIPKLPYIGGKSNSQTINLIMGAIVLSIIFPLENENLSMNQIGKIIFDTFDIYFNANPKFILKLIGKFVLTRLSTNKMKKDLEKSLARKYKEDFVIECVESESGEFDFGYNYLECALYKLYSKHNALKYLPYVCLGDYALFSSIGIGFSRTQTIANGGQICDFRFKKNGETLHGWPPEAHKEWHASNYS